MSDLLDILRAAAGRLDNDALTALGNRGLLRRAKKLAGVEVVEKALDTVRFQVDGHAVTLREDLQHATCSCPATGMCAQILAVLLHLRDEAGPTAEPAAVGPELQALSVDEVDAWAGKALIRQALRLRAQGVVVELAQADDGWFEIAELNATVRWIAGNGLRGMTCSHHDANPCLHRVLALVALQLDTGLREPTGMEELRASRGAPRSREEILGALSDVLREIAVLGLTRSSAVTAQRLRTLAVSAHGVDLPRLERMCVRAAEEVSLAVQRHMNADPSTLLRVLAELHALIRGLRVGTATGLVGRHKARFQPVGRCRLTGCGAQAWRTRTGYHGLTLVFWEAAHQRWQSWSDVRPIGQDDFDPLRAFGEPGPWEGLTSRRQASRSVVQLTDAWRSGDGRLSGRPATRGRLQGDAAETDLPPVLSDWSDLAPLARAAFAPGLAAKRDQRPFVVVRAESWEPAVFDPVRQELTRIAYDASGRTLPMRLWHQDWNPRAIEAMERLPLDDQAQVFCELRLEAGRLSAEPISVRCGGNLHHLSLDPPPPDPVAVEAESWYEEPPSELCIRLERAWEALIRLAEGGIGGRAEETTIASHGAWMNEVGLSSGAAALEALASAIQRQRRSTRPAEEAAGSLFEAAYLVHLTKRQVELQEATPG